MLIYQFWKKDPGKKASAPDGQVVAMEPRSAALMAAEKIHSSVPEKKEHVFSVWVRQDETDEIHCLTVKGVHTVQWSIQDA